MNVPIDNSVLAKELPISDVKQIRPWVRYWARLIDINIGSSLVGLFCMFIPQVLKLGILTTAFISISFTIFLEALLLSTWGMTPGKSLFQVFVRNSEGGKLTFFQAVKRCISVWGWGLGFGIPVVSLILLGMSYQYIEENGVAKWDISSETHVSHRKIGIPRIVFIVVLSMGFLWLTFTQMSIY